MAKIVLISGSMNPNSTSKSILKRIGKVLDKQGHDTDMICVLETNFPLYHPLKPMTDEMQKVSKTIQSADAFVIGSPEYHGGYSGALKNLLDYQDGSGFMQKPVALVSSSGGMKAGINTLNSLRLIFRSLHAHVIPQQLAVCEKELNEKGELDEGVQKQLLTLVKGLLQEISLRYQSK
ncbi:NADPH-dependent FMN reductase [Halalkalibacterium halodurans]|uniref:FMN-dependent NADH-azoreductase n=1 Tax=Halalkalibacterium halodurans TaxID=86665 RepID=A0A0M0KJJ7_ALKHA|nr:NADPH-dependent FMN reductase [Halalkalibacterium halodurans]TPE68687.1 NAD(P)H-dependent oxidoreductase [Halalkalibacterium halodurans]